MASPDNELNAFLVTFSDAIRGLTDPGAVARTTCRWVAEHLGATEAHWSEVDWDRREFVIDRAFPPQIPSPPIVRRGLDAAGAVAETILAGRSFVLGSTESDPRLAGGLRGEMLSRKIASAVVVPVTANTKLCAALSIAQPKPRRWKLEEVVLLEAVAARTWAEVERARAVAALEVELADARELQRISSSLIEKNDGGALYEQVLAAARSLMRSDFASIQMLSPTGDLLLLAHDAFHPASAEFWQRVSLDDRSACAMAMGRRTVIIVPDVETCADFSGSRDLEEFRRSGIRAVQSTPLRSRDGCIVGMISTHWREVHTPSERELRLLDVLARQAADLIERRLAEEALRASEGKYRTLFESVDEGVARLKLIWESGRLVDFRWLEHNAAFARETGLSNVVGKRRSEVFTDVPTQLLALYARVAESGEPARVEHFFPQVGRWFSVLASRISGSTDELVVVFANITERKRADEALRRSEAHNAYLVRLGDALRPLGDAAAIERAAMEVLRRQLDVDRAFYSEFDGTDLMVDEVHEMDPVAAVSVPMVKDGRLVAALTVHTKTPRAWTDEDVALIQETAERTWGAVERARATAALRESERLARSLLREATSARAEAEAANRAKDEFLATLSHELRTPLAAIVLWARALHAGAVRPEEIRRAVGAIVESAESQSRLIDDLLDLSRLTSGKIQLQHTAVDVRQVLEDAVDTIKPAALAKNITVSTSVGPMKGHAWLDEGRIKQVLWNVLSNAVKFTPEGGTVKVLAEKRHELLEVVVVDDGEGIDKAFLPHVFEKFRQADMADSRRYMGLGIGLSIAKRLTELHDGTIEAESDGLGRGATFRVRIPCADAAAPAPSRAATPARSLEGVRILLVEDDRSTRVAMLASLENAGARVSAFSAGHDAVNAVENGAQVDVLISDLGLPRMSGIELIGHLARHYEKQSKPLLPSCAVSAHAREIDRQAAIEAGFDLHLTKPVTPESLVEAVADLAGMMRDSASE